MTRLSDGYAARAAWHRAKLYGPHLNAPAIAALLKRHAAGERTSALADAHGIPYETVRSYIKGKRRESERR